MNFNLGELEDLFKDIQEIIDYVEGSKLKDRRTTLYLANGENITYCVTNSSIAHLIGINTEYLSSTRLFKSTNSFEILKEMCENPYRIHKQKMDGHLNYESFISEHIREKIDCFKENIKINLYETEFVCVYDKNKSFYTSKKNENCDYIIVKQYEDGKIGVIYIVKNGSLSVPMSNRIFNSLDEAKEELKEILIGQDITLLLANSTYNVETDFKKNFHLPLNYKSEKICELKKYKTIFNCSTDVISDYKYTLDKLTTNRDSFFETNSVIEVIVDAIVNKSLIDRSQYEDSTLLSIIDACNDHIFKSSSSNNGDKSYTSLIKDLEEAKQTILKLEEKNGSLENDLKIANESNSILANENKEQKNIIENIYKLTKPRIK